MSQTKAQLIDGKSAEIEFTGGSASGPAISFTGDSNTGIYSPGADQIAVATNGVGRLLVDASGRLGVGTASPSSLFHLSGNSGTAVFTLSDPANGMTGKLAADPTTLSLGTTTNHAVLCYTNSVERLRITSAGLVGIGTSSPSSSHTYKSKYIRRWFLRLTSQWSSIAPLLVFERTGGLVAGAVAA
jgi:hypothetical protein